MNDHLPVLHIVGAKNSGKTFLLRWLIEQLTACGLRIGALKHSMHNHPIDKPGSDSEKLRQAGANPTAFWANEGLAVFFSHPEENEGWEIIRRIFSGVDLLLIESFGRATGPKLVITDGTDQWQQWSHVIALVSGGPVPASAGKFPIFGKNDPRLLQFVLDYFNLNCP
jgi:molybdopterin-guanine dinucleotide biosynthesis protein MobB